MVGGTVVALANPIPSSPTYEWLCTLPMAASAGGVMCCLYEGSKNYNSVTQYALRTVESSMKKAASTFAPVIQKLNKPIQVVDSYAASKLVNLGEKVPALKYEPRELVTYFNESKKNLAVKITENHTAISTCLTDGKGAVTGRFYSWKKSLYSRITAMRNAVSNSRAGVLVGEVKEAVSTHLVQGKETLGSGVTAAHNAVYSRIQSGAEYLANSRAGVMVGAGIDCTLKNTERLVEYLIPELENEKQLFFEQGERGKYGLLLSVTDADLKQKEGEVKGSPGKYVANRMEHVYMIFCKVKLRMCYRFMQCLQDMQCHCKDTLQQLKDNVDLRKMARTAHDGLDKQYRAVTLALKDPECHIRQLPSHKDATREKRVRWLSQDGEEEDNRIEWLAPRAQGTLQASLGYAKQLSKIVFHMFWSITVTVAYLPKQLKNGTDRSYKYAQEMNWTLKPKRGTSDNITEKDDSAEEDITESTDEDDFVIS